MLVMSYNVGADALVPGLDDVARLAIFDELVDLHNEKQREHEREQSMSGAQELRSKWGLG